MGLKQLVNLVARGGKVIKFIVVKPTMMIPSLMLARRGIRYPNLEIYIL